MVKYIDDHHRNPNIDNRDHLVGQLTSQHLTLKADPLLLLLTLLIVRKGNGLMEETHCQSLCKLICTGLVDSITAFSSALVLGYLCNVYHMAGGYI